MDLKFALLLPLILATAPVDGEMVTGEGQQPRSVLVPAPLQEDSTRFALYAGGHHGGGDQVENGWSI